MKHLLIFALLLTSCRSAQWHFEKAQSKGMTLETVTETKTVISFDTIRDVLTNEILRIDTIYQVKTETRTQPRFIRLTRQERKAIQDSMKHEARMLKLKNNHARVELRNQTKQNRVNQRTARTEIRQQERTERTKARKWSWLWFAVVGGGLLGFMLRNLPRLIMNNEK